MPYPDLFDSMSLSPGDIQINVDGTITLSSSSATQINSNILSNVTGVPQPDRTVVVDADTVFEGDLIVVGNIYSGYKFPLSHENKLKCISYFRDLYGLESGIDFYTVPNGIVVKMPEKERFKQLIAEVLI